VLVDTGQKQFCNSIFDRIVNVVTIRLEDQVVRGTVGAKYISQLL